MHKEKEVAGVGERRWTGAVIQHWRNVGRMCARSSHSVCNTVSGWYDATPTSHRGSKLLEIAERLFSLPYPHARCAEARNYRRRQHEIVDGGQARDHRGRDCGPCSIQLA